MHYTVCKNKGHSHVGSKTLLWTKKHSYFLQHTRTNSAKYDTTMNKIFFFLKSSPRLFVVSYVCLWNENEHS